jgi:ATP-binding cassette subfamily F protein 2
MKRYQAEQNQIADMKDYIARFGHGSAKLARQAQSKEKVLSKMVAGGLTEKVSKDKVLRFYFPSCGTLPPPVLMIQHVKFAYSDGSVIYKDLDFGVDLDARIALVGPNGAGKSTLLKLIHGELEPTDGLIRKHSHLRMARFHQHLADQLDFELTPIEFMQSKFPEDFKDLENARRAIGRYGLTGKHQMMPMKYLSDGQQCRVIFAWLCWTSPHMLLLDEPTNHLDIETIDALAVAINEFDGGLILVSHDFRLISQVAREIWVCEKQKITKWEGDIASYKEHLRTQCGIKG